MISTSKPKKCKQCKAPFQPWSSTQVICYSHECAREFARAKREQEERKKAREQAAEDKKQREKLKRRADWLKDTEAAFNAYIRARDVWWPCISCGRHHQGQYHAGHYLSVGARPHLRFDERNVHKQCMPCNKYLSGNLIEYRIGLIQRIGAEAVEALEVDHSTRKYTIAELQQLIQVYRQKLKEIEKQ